MNTPEAPAASLADAYAACRAMARIHYENFPVASRFLPADKRDPVAAVYAFARTADDFADESFRIEENGALALSPSGEPGPSSEERLRLLADWRARLETCATDHKNHPVFRALADTVRKFSLPLEPFHRLITAFEMDVRQNRHKTFDDLLFYCRHSANPVGELVLRIFGQWTERRGAWSDAICSALQLANFWQDVTVDARKDRLYIPLEDLQAFGLKEQAALRGPATTELREMMSALVDRTWTLFRQGRPLCADVSGALRTELKFAWLGGTRILEKIDGKKWDVWSGRPRLRAWDAPLLMGRALAWRREN